MKKPYPRWLRDLMSRISESDGPWVGRFLTGGCASLVGFFVIQMAHLVGIVVFLVPQVSERGIQVLWSSEFKVWDEFRNTGFGAVISILSVISGGLLACMALVFWLYIDAMDEDEDSAKDEK